MLHRVDGCQHCGSTNIEIQEISDKDKRQVFDIPPTKMKVTEHRRQTGSCLDCGKEAKTSFSVVPPSAVSVVKNQSSE